MKTFLKETELCAAFISSLPKNWVAYPETYSDILLVRKEDGFQIGVEAKLKLNAKVITQIAEPVGYYYSTRSGPDCRAILVPEGVNYEFTQVCSFLGITVIRMSPDISRISSRYYPCLPVLHAGWPDTDWFEFAPTERVTLPEYIPDVVSGASSPVSLTFWKIGAIKLAITLEKQGYITRQDFKEHKISLSRWIAPGTGWLVRDDKGRWVRGKYLPDFKKQHPVNYAQIEADYNKWKIKEFVPRKIKK